MVFACNVSVSLFLETNKIKFYFLPSKYILFLLVVFFLLTIDMLGDFVFGCTFNVLKLKGYTSGYSYFVKYIIVMIELKVWLLITNYLLFIYYISPLSILVLNFL